MKLRNKKTGQIGNFIINKDHFECVDLDYAPEYRNIAELNAEWEDVPEEPKESEYYWYIGYKNDIRRTKYHHTSDFADNQVTETRKEIGNCFESLEEAEKAVEKLKAFANLRKRGLKFNGWDEADRGMVGEFAIYCDALNLDGIEQELELVFGREMGGEE